MDYEKKYKEALEKARKINSGEEVVTPSGWTRLEVVFPELRESEDERKRKELVQFLTEIKNISESGRDSWHVRKEDAGMCDSFLSYLEKQKEQKPAWSEDDDVMFKTAKKIIWESEASDGTTNKVISWLEGRFKSILLQPNPIVAVDAEQLLKILPPNPKWSEEDEAYRKSIISTIEMCMKDCERANVVLGCYESDIAWLKRLRPSWKPSEEQGDALVFAIKAFRDRTPIRDNLLSLYNDLKKL